MSYAENTLWCDGCGAEILWAPHIVTGKAYCCQDCSQGIKCQCAERQEWDDEYQETTSLGAGIGLAG